MNNKKKLAHLLCCVVFVALSVQNLNLAYGAPAKGKASAEEALSEDSDSEVSTGGFKPLLLDGALVKAVEQYVQPSRNQMGLGAGIFPVNPYYFGFQVNGDFVHYFSESFAWEVLNGTYVFSVEKNLTTDLARNFGVNPIRINRLEWLVSTNGISFFTYGKAVILSDIVRYWRAGLLYGAAFVGTTQYTRPAVNMGIRMEFYAGSSFSWLVEIRNTLVLQGSQSLPTMVLGAGIGL